MQEIQLLEKKAKSDKKLFEKYDLNPFGYKVNQAKHYLVSYFSRNQLKGLAVISSSGSVSQEEFEQSFEKLTLLNALVNQLDKEGSKRVKLEMFPFEKIRDYLRIHMKSSDIGEEEKRLSESVLSMMMKSLDMQKELVNLFENYNKKVEDIISGKGYFVDEDVEEIFEIFIHFDYTQFQQVSMLHKNTDTVDRLLESTPSSKMNAEIKEYLLQFSSSEKQNMKQQLEKVAYVENQDELPEEKYKEVVRTSFLQRVESLNNKNRKLIRNNVN
ncbi:hypothetical protein [Pontibacillus salipaludis]|uniref:Uncharacterized protein n=1 Tax=Pontibacillus salipaludis TaxID=1697394 RepID=A0ABQ1Q9M0_9BACI|nr:hypothetical protein [Pontibacillus salipaludis]GGD20291.1 hypothetical protein GCM10011389_29920 [Pontibacillus salipaludis]